MNQKTKKLIILNLPYAIIGLFCSNIGEAWRMAAGTDISTKLLGFFTSMGTAWGNPMPSFHPFDLCIGLAIGAAFRLVVYVRSKNARKYRHGEEYGSARWGGPKDIEPFADPVFQNNVILCPPAFNAATPVGATITHLPKNFTIRLMNVLLPLPALPVMNRFSLVVKIFFKARPCSTFLSTVII